MGADVGGFEEMMEPTAIGIQKYGDGYYHGVLDEAIPCVCVEQCLEEHCGGKCGCEACRTSYMDFLSTE